MTEQNIKRGSALESLLHIGVQARASVHAAREEYGGQVLGLLKEARSELEALGSPLDDASATSLCAASRAADDPATAQELLWLMAYVGPSDGAPRWATSKIDGIIAAHLGVRYGALRKATTEMVAKLGTLLEAPVEIDARSSAERALERLRELVRSGHWTDDVLKRRLHSAGVRTLSDLAILEDESPSLRRAAVELVTGLWWGGESEDDLRAARDLARSGRVVMARALVERVLGSRPRFEARRRRKEIGPPDEPLSKVVAEVLLSAPSSDAMIAVARPFRFHGSDDIYIEPAHRISSLSELPWDPDDPARHAEEARRVLRSLPVRARLAPLLCPMTSLKSVDVLLAEPSEKPAPSRGSGAGLAPVPWAYGLICSRKEDGSEFALAEGLAVRFPGPVIRGVACLRNAVSPWSPVAFIDEKDDLAAACRDSLEDAASSFSVKLPQGVAWDIEIRVWTSEGAGPSVNDVREARGLVKNATNAVAEIAAAPAQPYMVRYKDETCVVDDEGRTIDTRLPQWIGGLPAAIALAGGAMPVVPRDPEDEQDPVVLTMRLSLPSERSVISAERPNSERSCVVLVEQLARDREKVISVHEAADFQEAFLSAVRAACGRDRVRLTGTAQPLKWNPYNNLGYEIGVSRRKNGTFKCSFVFRATSDGNFEREDVTAEDAAQALVLAAFEVWEMEREWLQNQ